MIDYIVGGEFLNVACNKGANPYINNTHPITGMVAFDGGSQHMKVYDGSGWQTIGGGSATVNLTQNAISVLKWAEKKMFEEYARERLAETNPTIKDLVNQIKDKEEQIKMVQTLLNSPGNDGPVELMGS